MVASHHMTAGITVSIGNKLYRVESVVKVTVPKGTPFIKAKLRDLAGGELVEKNFKPDQQVKDVSSADRRLEFLYLEGKDYLCLDIGNLEQVLVPSNVIGKNAHYLKEGVEMKVSMFGETIFAVELPQFLELMVAKTEEEGKKQSANSTKMAVLETGARVEVPLFVEVGDIIKVDTTRDEYIQRV